MKVLLFVTVIFLTFACNRSKRERILATRFKDAKQLAWIKYSYSGCFGGETYNLNIFEKSGHTNALLSWGKNFVSVVELNDRKMELCNQFIEELKDKKFALGDCTTVAEYAMQVGDLQVEKTDRACDDWNGFDKLIDSIFQQKEYP